MCLNMCSVCEFYIAREYVLCMCVCVCAHIFVYGCKCLYVCERVCAGARVRF